jgi:hypothetical protein
MPPEIKICPYCGVPVEACPEPCGDWECAHHAHLGKDCASVAGEKYRKRQGKWAALKGFQQLNREEVES